MKIPQLLSLLALAASLSLTSIVSTAHAQAAAKPKSTRPGLPPSVLGGKPMTLSVYNFTENELSPFWITPNGDMQPVPDGKPIPPTGTTPVAFPTFQGATLILKFLPKGGGKWAHLTGANVKPFVVFGTPPDGFKPPEAAANAAASAKRKAKTKPGSKSEAATDPTGDFAEGTNAGTSGSPSVGKNNSAPSSAPGTRARGRKRGRNGSDAPDINITNIKVVPVAPATFPAASATDPSPAPAEAPPADDPASATESKSAPKAKKPFTKDSPVIVEFLHIHNAARADVGAAPLEWSPELAKNARDWAAHIARTGRLEHQPNAKYGENIGTGKGEDYTPASAANAWLSEKANFHAESNDPLTYRVTVQFTDNEGKTMLREHDGPTAHYTQMVWAKSTMVGVGTARTKDGTLVVVACYNPRGNIKDEKPY